MPYETDGASIHRRPDAVSPDYLTALSLGPVAISDASQGLVSHVWRGRLVGNEYRISRSDTEVWEDEVLLFTIVPEDGEVRETDFGFTQNGDPVVVLERGSGEAGASELWIWFFDSTAEDFVLTNFGLGRNPRVLLDSPDPAWINESDVLVVYVSDTQSAFVWREQRDRYGTEYVSPHTATEDDFLEDVVRGRDHRVHLVCSARNQITGRYDYYTLSSALYPIEVDTERVDISFGVQMLDVKRVLLSQFVDTEELDVSFSVSNLSVLEAVIEYLAVENERLDFLIVGLSLLEAVIAYTTETETETINFSVLGLDVKDVIIEAHGDDHEAAEVGFSVTGLTVDAAA